MVYGFHLDRPAVEEDPTQPESVYTGSKLAAEILVRAHTPGRLRGSVVARLANVYGPGIGENTVLGRLMGQAVRQEALHVLDERPVRDFIHVDDAVEALVRLADIDALEAFVVNVSTARGVRIGDAVGIVAKITGIPIRKSGPVTDESTTQLVLSNARLERLTGWHPQIQLEDGLEFCLKGSGALNPVIEQKL
jgi:UDP-glucose 4-epimerase